MAKVSRFRPMRRKARPAWTCYRPRTWFSRRARAIPLYAALRSLGRDGLTDLVDRCCDHARRIAARLDDDDDVEILNDTARGAGGFGSTGGHARLG